MIAIVLGFAAVAVLAVGVVLVAVDEWVALITPDDEEDPCPPE